MSTYCERIVEYKGNDGVWHYCGKSVDCYHAFDSWNNEKYWNRGFPSDISEKSLEQSKDDDGNDIAFNKSYLTMEELMVWAKEKRNEFRDKIVKYFNESGISLISKKIDFMAINLANSPHDMRDAYENKFIDNDKSDNYDYFNELFTDSLYDVIDLEDSLSKMQALAENKASEIEGINVSELPYITEDRIRLIFFYE